MRVLTVVGARPQFIKAAPVSRAMRQAGYEEYLVHTGQHYDHGMSQVFFDELGIPEPNVNLGIGSGSHGSQTGQMLARIEAVIQEQKPDWVLIYGDTNSTLAGALAGVKLHTNVAHVEAGLRSFNRAMPEEINRVVTDHVSDVLFCPSQTAIDNLKAEGIIHGVYLVGDVMAETLAFAAELAPIRSTILERLHLEEQGFLLATLHRAENTDDPIRLAAILAAFDQISEKIVFPMHPRTHKVMQRSIGKMTLRNVRFIDPVGYLDMVRLAQSARMILTDSGGLQKEAYWLKVPCITLRDETEWIETVETGWNCIAGAETKRIVRLVGTPFTPTSYTPLYDGQTSKAIIEVLRNGLYAL